MCTPNFKDNKADNKIKKKLRSILLPFCCSLYYTLPVQIKTNRSYLFVSCTYSALLYLSIRFGLNFWSLKRTSCSSLSVACLWTSTAANKYKVQWNKYLFALKTYLPTHLSIHPFIYLSYSDIKKKYPRCAGLCICVYCVCACVIEMSRGERGWLNRVVMLIQSADCIMQCIRETDWTWPC